MNKDIIKLGMDIYYNTTGANNIKISQKGIVVDIGVSFIWVMLNGNLGCTPVKVEDLSIEPLYKVTNMNIKNYYKKEVD